MYRSLQMNDLEWNMMLIPLKFTWQPTQDELIYLKELVCLRMKQRELIPFKQQDYINPSMIIDGFLYHGDMKHAMNKILLEELDIRRIINVCDCQLGQEILDQLHVLWINLDDDTYTDIAQYFKMTNEFLQSCKAKGEKVLVHCQMGVSRSSSIVRAYLMKYNFSFSLEKSPLFSRFRYHHDSLDKAYDYLVEQRLCAEPNLGFLLQLIRYEKQLRKTNETKNSVALISPMDELTKTKNAQSNIKRENIVFRRRSNSSSCFRDSWSLCVKLCCWPFRNTRSQQSRVRTSYNNVG